MRQHDYERIGVISAEQGVVFAEPALGEHSIAL
jgi:hypothetical protein